jgi:uridine kinase
VIGDRLIIETQHTERAVELSGVIIEQLVDSGESRFTVSIAGESGAGKSELAAETARLLEQQGYRAGILQQDDYFVFPPKTNHEMRRRNLAQVSEYEVKLDFLDSNLRSFKRGESPIYKPLVIFGEDRITSEEMDVENLAVLIAEGTYTTALQFVDLHVFIDQDYIQTLETRKRRGRDRLEAFVSEVLEREHEIISRHMSAAHIIIPADFSSLRLQKNQTPKTKQRENLDK